MRNVQSVFDTCIRNSSQNLTLNLYPINLCWSCPMNHECVDLTKSFLRCPTCIFFASLIMYHLSWKIAVNKKHISILQSTVFNNLSVDGIREVVTRRFMFISKDIREADRILVLRYMCNSIHLSQCMRFPTMSYFDMCRFRQASAASF